MKGAHRRAIFMVLQIFFALLIMLGYDRRAAAFFPQAEENADIQAPVAWPLEWVELNDGTKYGGFVQEQRDEEIDFVEIHRPPGKPMFAVVRPIPQDEISRIVSLSDADRADLMQRFEQFRHRVWIEAGRMERIALDERVVDGHPYHTYDGPWFRLESSADRGMTRRCVVRVEQVFRAYRHIFPPRRRPDGKLRVMLLGSMQQYERYLKDAGFRVSAPAFFATSENLVVAGSDLNRFAQRLAQVNRQHAEIRKRYRRARSDFAARMKDVARRLGDSGLGEAEIEQEIRIRTLNWEREYESMMHRLQVADLQNEAAFAALTRTMFARLYHEAFHAYAANYLVPPSQAPLPRWLDEGLAQIFESGQLESGTLRIDAPDPDRLRRLQDAIRRDDLPSVRSVISASDQAFVEERPTAEVQRRYLVSWGLAYYLVFQVDLLGSERLEQYVKNEGDMDPAARFTQLIGMPLGKFEKSWREAMLGLAAGSG